MMAARPLNPRWLPWVGIGLAGLMAVALGWTSVERNWQRACMMQEWPNFSSCPVSNDSVPGQVRNLRNYIGSNPGDSASWLALALLAGQPGGVAPLNEDAVLGLATRLAGQDGLLRRAQAARALARGQWPQAVGWLVRLVQDQHDPDAARILAALVNQPQAQTALVAALQPGSRWLGPVLGNLAGVKVPLVQAMPLVAKALPLNLVSPEMGQTLMRGLKANGNWEDAHALWLWLVGGSAPLIFNGDFEQGFIGDGFDWEFPATPPSSAGVLIAQPSLDPHGRVLQLEFTGRPMALPLARQYLVLPDGSYTFTARYMASHMRSEHGLVWTFNCVAGGRELARTAPLMDTQGQWQQLGAAVVVPTDCGGAVVLQLQTQAAYEGLAGLRGQMYFDAFGLTAR